MTKKKILLVEDNDDDVLLTRRALQKKNIPYELIIAQDGKEAIDFLFGENGKDQINPTLVLLDLNLPRINGFQVLEKVKTSTELKSLPIVILTTSATDEDIARSYQLGANSYVRKPVDFGEFSQTVEQLGLYWLVLNQTAHSN